MMNALAAQSYVFDPRPNFPFLITAKRYWIVDSPYSTDPSAFTLVFTHGTGFHKEIWEPTIDDLHLLLNAGNGTVKVCEMWTIDAPNHGDAAILNEEELKWGYEPSFGWEEYGRAIHVFLSGFGSGVDVDFSQRKVIAIGHSMGAACLSFSLTYYPPLKFEAIVFCELMAMNRESIGIAGKALISGAANRRDTWPSREEAYKLLKARPAWKTWDDRVLRLYVEHGMRPLPTANYPDKIEGLTLKCTRKQETACYLDPIAVARAYRLLGAIVNVKKNSTHMIYGAIDDVISASAKEDVINNVVGGIQNLASFARVENAGHLILQTNPKGLAEKLYNVLIIATASDSPTKNRPNLKYSAQARL